MAEPEDQAHVREPPPSLVPPRDSVRAPARTIPEFPPAPLGLLGVAPAHAPGAEPPARAPRPPRSLPPMPGVEPILELAVKARDEGRWDAALDAYKKAPI